MGEHKTKANTTGNEKEARVQEPALIERLGSLPRNPAAPTEMIARQTGTQTQASHKQYVLHRLLRRGARETHQGNRLWQNENCEDGGHEIGIAIDPIGLPKHFEKWQKQQDHEDPKEKVNHTPANP
jgi:hypothetical protein